jgi:hypothetical protein
MLIRMSYSEVDGMSSLHIPGNFTATTIGTQGVLTMTSSNVVLSSNLFLVQTSNISVPPTFLTLQDDNQSWAVVGSTITDAENANVVKLSIHPSTAAYSTLVLQSQDRADVVVFDCDNDSPFVTLNATLNVNSPIMASNGVHMASQNGRDQVYMDTNSRRMVVMKDYNLESDHQFIGLGVGAGSGFGYQVASTTQTHTFSAALSANQSVDWVTIQSRRGEGNSEVNKGEVIVNGDVYVQTAFLSNVCALAGDSTIQFGEASLSNVNDIFVSRDVVVNGKVGVGTTPVFTMDIFGDINVKGNFYQNANAFKTSQWTSGSNIAHPGGTSNIFFPVDAGSGGEAWVGIGTTNPLQALHVQGGTYLTSNVGIGTASPLQTLHVEGTEYVSGRLGVGVTNPIYSVDVAGDVNFTGVLFQNSSPFITSQWTSGSNLAHPGGTSNIFFPVDAGSGGEAWVGIGTTNPQQALHVQGGTYLTSNVGIGTASPHQTLHVEGTEYVSGRIGVGVTNPGYTVDVAGDVNFTGVLFQNSSPFITSQWTSGSNLAHPSGTSNIFFPVDAGSGGVAWVGIGTTNPQQALHVQGGTYLTSNVGIGTVSPHQALHVEGSEYVSGRLGVGVTNPGYAVDVAGDVNFTGVLFQNSSPFITSQWTSSPGPLNVGGTSNIFFPATVGSGGEAWVGIGTTNPQQALHIQGCTYLSSNLGIGVTNPSSSLHVVGTTSLMGGSVGIGTLSPTNTLHVSGTTQSDSVTIGANTLTPLTVFNVTGKSIMYGDTTVTGTFVTSNLQVLGNTYIVNAVQVASSNLVVNNLVVNNLGTGPGLSVTQSELQAGQTVAQFIAGSTYGLVVDGLANVGVHTSRPSEAFHVNGSARVDSVLYASQVAAVSGCNIDFKGSSLSNLSVVASSIAADSVYINGTSYVSPLQAAPVRQVFQSAAAQSSFNLEQYGNYTASASNAHVYYNGKRLGYINNTIKDYDIGYSFNATTSNTTYSVTLAQAAVLNDVVDITVWPIAGSAQSAGQLYQSFNSVWSSSVTSNATTYTTWDGSVGIGTTAPSYKLDVYGTTRSQIYTSATGSVSGGLTGTPTNVMTLTSDEAGMLTVKAGPCYSFSFVNWFADTPVVSEISSSNITATVSGGNIMMAMTNSVAQAAATYSYVRTL